MSAIIQRVAQIGIGQYRGESFIDGLLGEFDFPDVKRSDAGSQPLPQHLRQNYPCGLLFPILDLGGDDNLFVPLPVLPHRSGGNWLPC